MNLASELDAIAQGCYGKCSRNRWARDWSSGGCYLHLEVSEFIEALRGKHGSPHDEAADVLFVFLSVCKNYDLDLDIVLKRLKAQLET